MSMLDQTPCWTVGSNSEKHRNGPSPSRVFGLWEKTEASAMVEQSRGSEDVWEELPEGGLFKDFNLGPLDAIQRACAHKGRCMLSLAKV